MSNNNQSQNQSTGKNIFVTSDQSWLKASTNFQGINTTNYSQLDITNAPDLTDDEYNAFLSEERQLRTQVRAIDTWGKSAQQIAEEFTAQNMTDTLRQWAATHLRNIAIQIKRGDSDVLIVPTTQTLLEAANILSRQ